MSFYHFTFFNEYEDQLRRIQCDFIFNVNDLCERVFMDFTRLGGLPYKKGRNGFMTKDILEVFIEKKNTLCLIFLGIFGLYIFINVFRNFNLIMIAIFVLFILYIMV